jgi:hypothetical protein
MKKTLAVLLCLLPLVSSAQVTSRGQVDIAHQSFRDTDQITNFEYCRTLGVGNLVTGDGRIKTQRIETVGSSTTVSALTATTNTFTGLGVGDELLITAISDVISAGVVVTRRGQQFYRVITAKASDDSITVNVALDITNDASFTWRKLECGTAATNGWVPVHNLSQYVWHLNISQINTTTGVDYTLECRIYAAAAGIVTVVPSTTVTAATSIVIPVPAAAFPQGGVTLPYDECRFGTRLTTTDDGSDVGAAAEQTSVYLTGRLSAP